MIIQINKNLDKYKESVVAGMTARQIIHIIIAGGVSIAIVFGLYRFIGIVGAAMLCFPPVGLIALSGFSPDMMQRVKNRLQLMFIKPLKYSSDSESEQVIEDYYKEQERIKQIKLKKEKRSGKSRFFSFMKKKGDKRK